jgi:anthranilate synthase component 1
VDVAGSGFALGWVGWLGYEERFETMGSPGSAGSAAESAFGFVDRAIEFDHAAGTATLLALGSAMDEWRVTVAEALEATATAGPLRQAQGPVAQGPVSQGPVAQGPVAQSSVPEVLEGPSATWRDSDDEYLAMIASCQASIAAGDAYQLCLTTSVTIDATPEPVETYLRLRASSPTHHGALIRIGETSLLSASPEQFLSITPGGVIESKPIKGTRPRGATPAEDEALAGELLASEKERAENLMIVDLMRNDIGRVSEIGSVEVPSLLEVETYAQVHQLVSTVRGQLASGLSPMDAVVACFPAGSMTGTPKSSAVKILDALEGHPRGVYSGAFGYFGLDGRVDLAMTIRTIILKPSGATIGAGGGITALSVPAEELAEVKLKAAALLEALGAQ